MYTTICNVIKDSLGEAALVPLIENLGEDQTYDLVQNIFYAKNVSEIVECLVGSQNEDVYWFLWDNLMYVIEEIDPGEKTKKMIECYHSEKAKSEATVFHASDPAATERVILSPMDYEASEALQRTIAEEGEDKAFEESLQRFAKFGRVYFKIELIDTKELIGYVGLCFARVWGGCVSDDTWNIEYYIAPPHRRKGYLTEAAKKMLELVENRKIRVMLDDDHKYIVSEYYPAVQMIKLMCDETNIASQRCAHELGFEQEGLLSLVRENEIYREYIFSKNF